jgi:hypothetical protein
MLMPRSSFAYVLLLLWCSGALAGEGGAPTAEYVGKEACAACHAEQLERWTGAS